jgi:hypothetical protein
MGVEAVWWIGLVGAVLLGLVLLKCVLILHRILVHVLAVARMARDAARSIATNARAVSRLAVVDEAAPELTRRMSALAASLAALERAVEQLPGVGGGRVP